MTPQNENIPYLCSFFVHKVLYLQKIADMKVIIESILFLFGLGDNPVPEYENKSDAEALSQDWDTVGLDIRKAIENYAR